jgi:hypothetical protein
VVLSGLKCLLRWLPYQNNDLTIDGSNNRLNGLQVLYFAGGMAEKKFTMKIEEKYKGWKKKFWNITTGEGERSTPNKAEHLPPNAHDP